MFDPSLYYLWTSFDYGCCYYHFFYTDADTMKTENTKENTNENIDDESTTAEHSLVLSYGDLSIWCYACETYIKSDETNLLLAKAGTNFSCFLL